jgi:hypothetical protein
MSPYLACKVTTFCQQYQIIIKQSSPFWKTFEYFAMKMLSEMDDAQLLRSSPASAAAAGCIVWLYVEAQVDSIDGDAHKKYLCVFAKVLFIC